MARREPSKHQKIYTNLILYSDQFVSLEGKEQSLSFHHEMEFHKEMEVCETVDMEGYR